MKLEKNCEKHGLTEGYVEKRGYIRCKKCRSESVTEARQRRKKRLVEYKGGCCEICGYHRCMEALDFHHLEENTKEFAISHRGLCKSWEKQRNEVDKCILLCANCHREVHAGIIQI